MGENLTIDKRMTLLQFTLTGPGIDPLTTKSQKVATGLSYYFCMVNFLLTRKTEKKRGRKGGKKGEKKPIIFNFFFFFSKSTLFPLFLSLHRISFLFSFIFGYFWMWAGITFPASYFLHCGTCFPLHIKSNDMVASARKSLSSVPRRQHTELSLLGIIWRCYQNVLIFQQYFNFHFLLNISTSVLLHL